MTTVPEASSSSWSKLSAFVAATLGLHFPPPRQDDLKRGLRQAARELGFAADAPCIDWLLAQPPAGEGLQALANHLTVGETYFFRDRPVLDALANEVLPELIRARRGRRQQLRLWCAACCTGEEAYTLAILLHQLLPDLAQWEVSITATDVNTRFLQKARGGRYGEWSFRDAPAWLRPRYFERHADGGATVLPEIRRMVRFDRLNLAQPSPGLPGVAGLPGFGRGDLMGLDLVVCRNALMYFAAPQAARVVGQFWHCLGERGWLVTAPGEASGSAAGRFETASFPGAVLLRKLVPPPPGLSNEAPVTMPVPVSARVADELAAPAAEAAALAVPHSAEEPHLLAQQARACANRGELAQALACCDRWLAQDKMDPAAHYLRGMVLLEQGEAALAQEALQRAIYLDASFVLAHFACGQLARAGGDALRGGRHFANALRLLQPYPSEALLPGSDDLSAGRLRETLRSLTMQPEGVS